MLADLSNGPDPRVQGLEQESEPDPENRAEEQRDHGVPARLGRYLGGSLRAADHIGSRGLKGLQRGELLILVAQAGREGTPGFTTGLQGVEAIV